MSKHSKTRSKSLSDLLVKKQSGERLSVVTCYDAAFARLIDQTDIDMVLVGDSLGNVIMGYETTIPVKLDDMIHHSRCVSRALKSPFLVTDLPFGSYTDEPLALRSAIKIVQEGGAHAVKLEGGRAICPQVKAIVSAGIPVVAHLGLTPQSVHALSGYKVQGRSQDAASEMIQDARALESAGASFLVLELVPRGLAKQISEALSIPTIGIGAGGDCDGQVLVLHDLLGFDDSFSPKFLKRYANIGKTVKDALDAYIDDVREKKFPSDEQSFT